MLAGGAAKVREAGGFVTLDMEMYALKRITLDVFTETLDAPEFQKFWDKDAKMLADAIKRVGKIEEKK